MLTEEALIFLATLAATGLLVLGVLELVWPSTPRRPARYERGAPRARSPFEPPLSRAPAEAPAASGAEADAAVPPVTVASEESRTLVATDVVDAVEAPAGVGAMTAESADVSRIDVDEPAPPVAAPREPRPHVLPIETCARMFEEGRYAEVVSLGSAALEVHARLGRVSDPSGEAALIALVGQAKQGLGDGDGARLAFVDALRAAGPSARPTYVAHVVRLAAAAVDAVPGAGVTVAADAATAQARELLETAAAVEDALAIVPGDPSLQRARTAVREAVAVACDRLVERLAAGDASAEARAIVLRALADDTMPAASRERLGQHITPMSSAEIGQLTAQAIRCIQEGRDGDAVDALERAERLFVALPRDTVPDERLEELARRLWWGYTKAGLYRIETGRLEEALEPLFRALQRGGLDEERLGETRAALVDALEALVEEKASELATRGPVSGDAEVVLDKLSALLRSTVERGVSERELGDAFARVEMLRQVPRRP